MITVLVVDDSAVMRRLIATVLATDPTMGIVGAAADGQEALAEVARLNPDLVLLDVEMPVLDGVRTVAELRKANPGYP